MKLQPEHLPAMVVALRSAIISGAVTIAAAREFCDATFNVVLEEIANGRRDPAPVREPASARDARSLAAEAEARIAALRTAGKRPQRAAKAG